MTDPIRVALRNALSECDELRQVNAELRREARELRSEARELRREVRELRRTQVQIPYYGVVPRFVSASDPLRAL